MKPLIYNLLLLLLLTACKTEKKSISNNSELQRQAQVNISTEKQAVSTSSSYKKEPQSKWQKINKRGFYFSGFASPEGSKEYDESFKPLAESELGYSLTPISIVATTISKKPKDNFGKSNKCFWANFVKFNHKGKEKIVFGEYIYVPVKKHKAKNLSIWTVKNYRTGVADEQGLTGCDEYHPLLLIDKNGNVHTIQEEEEEAEEPMYVSLVESDIAGDEIKSIKENDGKLVVNVLRTMQDEAKSYTIKIFKRDFTWFANKTVLKEVKDERQTSEGTKSIKELEDIALDKHLKSWNTESGDADTKLVSEYINYTKELISTHPESMSYPFRILVAERALYTETSSDNKLRFYSFNTQMGGSTQFFDTLYQTNENGTVKTTDVDEGEGGNGYYVSDIYTFNSKNKTYYVVIANKIASNRDIAQIAKAYTISNGELKPVKLFTTEKKAYQEIPVKYDFFSAMDKSNERPIRVIKYHYDKEEFHIAVVDNNGKVGDKNLIYKWTGNEFKYTGIK